MILAYISRLWKRKRLRAFSLGEALLSAFVLSFGLAVIMALIGNSIYQSFRVRNAVIGAELAQEGVELVRNVRDNDFVAGNDGFTQFSASKKFCRVDSGDSIGTLNCSNSQGNALQYFLSSNGTYYRYPVNGSVRRFSRLVYVDYDNSAKTATVRSFVYWGWQSSSMPSFVPASGNPANCTLNNQCTYTEASLTSWWK